MAYTFTELLDDIKTRGAVPTSQNTYTSARFLRLVNDEIRSSIVPMMVRLREDYYSYDIDTTVNATGLYNLHSRAAGGMLENVALIDGTRRLDLARYYDEDIVDTGTAPDGPPGFVIKRNQVQIYPPDGYGYSTFRQTIDLRPLEVVDVTSAAQITAISSNVLTFTSMPTTFLVTSTFDFCQAEPQFDTLAIDQAVSAITSTTLTFSSTLPTRLAVGDWVGLRGQTPVIQVVLELQPYLSQLVANTTLRGQTDAEAYKMGVEESKRLERNAILLLTPRVKKEGKKLVNRTGILRRGQ